MIPAGIAAWQMRLKLAGALAVFSVALTLAVPAAIGMWGTDPGRPSVITAGLLAAIALVWPLAVFAFASGMLVVFNKGVLKR